jgi:hypothetical protein
MIEGLQRKWKSNSLKIWNEEPEGTKAKRRKYT